MKLGDYASIRTGLPLSRKQANTETSDYLYTALTLKAISDDGFINTDFTEPYFATEPLKREYFTQANDVLVRLSAPYTATVIGSRNEGLLVSQHFTIIRGFSERINPHFLCWWLTKNRKRFYQSASGATLMGTISSGYIAEIPFYPPPIDVQNKIGILLELTMREAKLMASLSEAKTKLINATIIKMTSSTMEEKNHDQ
jgi:restriction endonuclease S subunit